MRIDQMLAQRTPLFSFEFFPPKTEAGVDALFAALGELRPLQPDFVSVTYGAGGSTRERTVELVARIRRDLGIEPMAHFTCVGSTTEELHGVLRAIADAGIENVLALRGDPPLGETVFSQVSGGLGHANELSALIDASYNFCIGGACYPEKHPEAKTLEDDLSYAQMKVQAGASFLITQLFFDNRAYFTFVKRARELGITVPIIPGIMPVTSVEQIQRFIAQIGATFPPDLLSAFRERRDDPAAVIQLGVAWSTLQCSELLANGAPGIHFYTLNRSPATRAILSALRAARPWETRA